MDLPWEQGSLWGIQGLPLCVLLASAFPSLCILSCGGPDLPLGSRPEAHLSLQILSTRARNLPQVAERVLDEVKVC